MTSTEDTHQDRLGLGSELRAIPAVTALAGHHGRAHRVLCLPVRGFDALPVEEDSDSDSDGGGDSDSEEASDGVGEVGGDRNAPVVGSSHRAAAGTAMPEASRRSWVRWSPLAFLEGLFQSPGAAPPDPVPPDAEGRESR